MEAIGTAIAVAAAAPGDLRAPIGPCLLIASAVTGPNYCSAST